MTLPIDFEFKFVFILTCKIYRFVLFIYPDCLCGWSDKLDWCSKFVRKCSETFSFVWSKVGDEEAQLRLNW